MVSDQTNTLEDHPMSRYSHLTIEERKSIAQFHYQELTIREIARRLGRSPSTISRELKRNAWHPASDVSQYHPQVAQMAYKERRKACVRKCVLDNVELRHWVHFLLGYLYWSPEEICQRLRKERGRCEIGTSTIYRALENGKLRVALRPFLRRKYKTFGKASKKKRKCFEKLIDLRPDEANDRSVIGHFEGDTIKGHGDKSCIVTLAERKSRFLVAGKCESKQVESVNPVIIEQLSRIPKKKRKTITFDQGPEFSKSDDLEKALEVDIYFAHPHSPWERGTNENTNGLLRQFYSKECNMGLVSQEDLDHVVALLNMRPRACLGWKTPYEVFFDQVLHFT